MNIRARYRSLSTAAVLALACLANHAAGQGSPAPDAPSDPAEPFIPAADDRPVRRLLREGSGLAGVQGRLRVDPATGWWRLVLDEAAHPGAAPTDLIMLPNGTLEEMLQVRNTAPEREAVFEVTGRVYVYAHRNFLLATYAPRVVAYEPLMPDAPTPIDDGAIDGAIDGDDSVENIMRELADAVGPLRRVPTTAPPSAAPATARPVRATTLLSRRGRLQRSPRGAWLFVFEADAEGQADPPLVVLPCLLLERMEQYVARTRPAAPILLSGSVLRFDSKRYVLPSMFRVASEREGLVP
jgi:hypothetical protein